MLKYRHDTHLREDVKSKCNNKEMSVRTYDKLSFDLKQNIYNNYHRIILLYYIIIENGKILKYMRVHFN